MKVSGQLEEASVELIDGNPTNLPEGRIWEDTTDKKLRAVLNGTVKTLSTSESEVSNTNPVLTAHIQDLAVTNPKLAANAVSTDKIVTGAVTGDKIANGTITNNKLATLRSRSVVNISRGSSTALTMFIGSFDVPANAKPFELKFAYKYDGLGTLGAVYGLSFQMNSGFSTPAPSISFIVYKRPTGTPLNGTHVYANIPAIDIQYVTTGDPAAAMSYGNIPTGSFLVIEDAPPNVPTTYEVYLNHGLNGSIMYGNLQLIREDLY